MTQYAKIEVTDQEILIEVENEKVELGLGSARVTREEFDFLALVVATFLELPRETAAQCNQRISEFDQLQAEVRDRTE